MKRFRPGYPTPDDLVLAQLKFIEKATREIQQSLKKGCTLSKWSREQILTSANALGTVRNVLLSQEKKT